VGEKRQIGAAGDKKAPSQRKKAPAWELIKLHFSGGNEIIVRRSDWTRAHIKMLGCPWENALRLCVLMQRLK